MKTKLLAALIMLTLGLGYCAPNDECSGLYQSPAQCRGTKGPLKTIVFVNGQPRVIVGKS